MIQLRDLIQFGSAERFIYHHEKGPDGLSEGERFLQRIDKAMEGADDPYEVVREKPGYTNITGATLILGDDSSKGLKPLLGLNEFGAGRCFASGTKEVASKGQTTEGFLDKVKKSVGYTMKIYANAMIQIGKYDILQTSHSAEQIYKRMQKIWAHFDKFKMKIHVSTIPPIDGETIEQKKRRKKLNDLIRETDEPIFNVIELAEAMEKVDTESPNLYIHDQTKEIRYANEKPEGKHWKLRRKTPKTEQEKMAVAYLTALTAGGRDNFKETEEPRYAGPPKAPYIIVGDSFSKPLEKSIGGTKKMPGHYTTSVEPEALENPEKFPQEPGGNTRHMAEKVEKVIVPQLQKKPAYRCAVIQAGAEDILIPTQDDYEMLDAEEAITNNIKRMYKACLESDPPIMVIAMTLPPMGDQIDRMYPGEGGKAQRERCHELWRKVNDFIIKEARRLSQHPLDWYKRIMCVRAHEVVGTRKGFIREKYKDANGRMSTKGQRQLAMMVSKAMNGMRDGIEFGKSFIPGFHPDKFEMEHHKKYRGKSNPNIA